jgi:hypothetical protein
MRRAGKIIRTAQFHRKGIKAREDSTEQEIRRHGNGLWAVLIPSFGAIAH